MPSAFLTLALEVKCQSSLFTLMAQASYPLDRMDPKMILDMVKKQKFHKSLAKNQPTAG
jgi:hypothetical protein